MIIGTSEVATKSWDFLNEIPEKPAEMSVVGVLQGPNTALAVGKCCVPVTGGR